MGDCMQGQVSRKLIIPFLQGYCSIIMYTYKIHLRRETDGGFTVSVPVLPGCITYGEDVDEAIAMAKEAIELYIEELQERGEVVPDDSNTLEYSLNLKTV